MRNCHVHNRIYLCHTVVFWYPFHTFLSISIALLYVPIYSNQQNPLTSLVEVVHKGGGWDERDRRLILWHFEELLKQRYKDFIEVLEVSRYVP